MLTLDRMRYLVKKGLGYDPNTEDDITNPDTDELLNLSLWELSDKYPFKEKECERETATVEGQDSYALPDDLDALIAVFMINDDRSIKLERMSFAWHSDNRVNDADHRGPPSRYLRRDNALVLWPVPDGIYTLNLILWKTVASLLEGTVDETGLPRNWDEIVVQGAIVKGHFFKQDYKMAREASNFQVGQIRSSVPTEAKEERDSRFAGVKAVIDDPEFDDHEARADYYYHKNLYGGRIP